MSIQNLVLTALVAHPKNPRIEPRQEVVDQIAAQLKATGRFDESHALIVRAVESGYQIVSGHHRWLAAQQAELPAVPCWVREFTDKQAYMELVLCNTQSELHPLEEGKHATESGMDLKAYAEATGKKYDAMHQRVRAWRVLHVSNENRAEIRDDWRNLAEIHTAPRWLWAALVKVMIEDGWTVAVTRDKVGAFKDVAEPPKWADSDRVAEALLTGQMKIAEVAKLQKLVDNAKVSGEFRAHLITAIESESPSLLSEVQAIVAHWEWQQANAEKIERDAELARQREAENARQLILTMRKSVSLENWKTLKPEEQAEILTPMPGEGGSFNKQESKDIEWAQWSWNPVTGCKHDCSYCYARDIAQSARMKTAYPNGFAPTFRSNALNAPKITKVPKEAATDARYKNVFTCSMADLFGRWVPKEWIDAVMLAVRGNPQWDFLFLTKFPQRLSEIEVPENAWMGTTVDLQARVANAEKAFAKVQCRVKWLSVEPLIEPLQFSSLEMFDWVVIGGASPSEKTPKWEPPYRWIDSLVRQCDDAKVPIYMKSNLGIANRVLELPLGLPLTQDPQQAPESFHYLGKAA
jgi:protein gp37/ParB-like chromosome segregation protein Spo0J